MNRAPFLTLWATVVAKRMGYAEDEALTLGKALAGLTAQSKGRRLGIYEPRPERQARMEADRDKLGAQTVEFMDRSVPCLRTVDGLRALTGTSPIRPERVRTYLQTKFKEDLPAVERRLTALASTFEPDELEGQAMGVYLQLRPAVPAGRVGWGQAGVLDLAEIDKLIQVRQALHRPV
ncbi:TPA: hypothetical protein DCY67_00080 [Candidatus Acetothermia bacterium]|nr:hypothetical protein [Candidatus Acetothermia bacterium]